MMNFGEKRVVGLFEEPTTYRHDFCGYSAAWGSDRETRGEFEARDRRPIKLASVKTLTGNDTLQKLDYESHLPFNTMWRPKEIVGTHPETSFCRKVVEDEGLAEAIKTRPRQYVSPAISLDNVHDPDTRKLMIDFTYMTTTSRAGKEAWAEFRPIEPCLPNTVFEKTVDRLELRPQLLANIPAGFQSAARKWDSIQEHYIFDTSSEQLKSQRQKIDYEKRLSSLITMEEKQALRNLIAENRLRLPYDKMPLSYGGFRPRFAIQVPLKAEDSSPFDPNLTVARAITARL